MAALLTGAFFVLVAIFARVTPQARMEWIAAGFVLGSGAALIVSLASYFAAQGGATDARIVGAGMLANPNRAAAIVALNAILAVHLAERARGRVASGVLLTYLAMAMLYVVLTGSRGGMLVLLCVLAAYVVIASGRGAIRVLVPGAAILVALTLAALVLVPDTADFVSDQLARDTYRPQIWREVVRLSLERPLLGHGLGYDEPILGVFAHPHNLLLSSLLYGGIPALLLAAAVFATCAVRVSSVPERSCRALAGCLLLLALIWTIPNGSVPITKPGDDWYHFWIPIALATGLPLRRAHGA
jgi:O-antigen ligase